MGAWGYGPYDNDIALDLFADVTAKSLDADGIEATLPIVMSAIEYNTSRDDYSCAYALAGVILFIAGDNSYFHGDDGFHIIVNTLIKSGTNTIHELAKRCYASLVPNGKAIILSPGEISTLQTENGREGKHNITTRITIGLLYSLITHSNFNIRAGYRVPTTYTVIKANRTPSAKVIGYRVYNSSGVYMNLTANNIKNAIEYGRIYTNAKISARSSLIVKYR